MYNDTTYTNNMTFTRFMGKSFGIMFLGLLVTALVAAFSFPLLLNILRMGFLGLFLIYGLELGVAIYFQARLMKMSKGAAYICYFVYCITTGLTFSTLPLYYEGGTIFMALFITAAMFGCMAIIGHTSNIDFTKAGPYLTMGLIAILVMSLINALFLHSSTTALFIDYAVIIIFLVMIAFDMQNLRRLYSASSYDSELQSKLAIFGAFSIYLDFLNIFLRVLSILGRNSDN